MIVDSLESSGGVETRLYHQASYLKQNGYEPIIITEYNLNDKLKEFENIILDFKAPNFSYWVDEIARRLRPEFIEFQFKSFRYIYDIDISALQKITTVGVCVHGIIKIEHSLMDKFDYRVYSCANSINKFVDAHRIPNFIQRTSAVWNYNMQNQALFISRIAKEKLVTLENFICICKENNIAYKIAGPIDFKNSRVVKFISDLEKSCFIGEIETHKYLSEHVNEYLFVGGVGQVPMEAAAFGIPALVLTLNKDFQYSTFMNKENFMFLKTWNFVINSCPKISLLGNVKAFFSDVDSCDLGKYSVSELVHDNLSIDKVMEEYVKIINNCRQ